MRHDRVTGWQQIECLDIAVVRPRSPSLLTAGRWLSPTGTEATIVSSKTVGRGVDPVPPTVSCPAVAKDAHLPVGRFVVDPQLRWHDLDGRHLLVSPALGLRLSVRADEGGFRKGLARLRRRPCVAVVEPLAVGDRQAVPGRAPDPGVLEGRYPALLTRWPVPVTSAPEAQVAPATRPTRLATGPAAFLRDEAAEPLDRPDHRADPAPV